MKILCIDVGRGTQDILLYDSEKNLENCTQLIIPSRAVLAEKALKKGISEDRDILFTGTTMGGFPLGPHFKEYVKRRNVYATPMASRTFRDDPDVVREMGVKVISEDEAKGLMKDGISHFEMMDIDINGLSRAIDLMGDSTDFDGIAVAVQDHGTGPKGMSEREFRFQNYRRLLDGGGGLFEFCYKGNGVPDYLTRMKAVAGLLRGAKNLLIMDTGMAAVLGSLEDEKVASFRRKLVVNVGNGHTLAVLLDGEEIQALFEHHTSLLDEVKLHTYIKRLLKGEVTHEEVFADGGHGLYVRERARFGNVKVISVIGPNRTLLKREEYYHPSPHGNMMLAGSYGLLRGYLARF
ncbi:MAG: DUF1786 family protein [Deltaproteobacteria bacterium]|nr:DUF1786 family protein [Deltaproteobacteria bacterium]